MTENPDDKPNRGRPLKLTPDIALGVAQCILDGNFRTVAGKRFGISPTTFKRWMTAGRKFPDGIYGQFRSLVLESESEAERLAVAAILRAGREDDPRHLEWWLERKHPLRWGRLHGELSAMKRDLAELRKILASPAEKPA